jgi:hypothetical protein
MYHTLVYQKVSINVFILALTAMSQSHLDVSEKRISLSNLVFEPRTICPSDRSIS